MRNRTVSLNNDNTRQTDFFVGFGGSQCTHGDIVAAASAMNNLDEKYGIASQIVNGLSESIRWEWHRNTSQVK